MPRGVGVRVSPSPPMIHELTLCLDFLNMILGRAKRGVSGVLHSQSALARLKSSSRAIFRNLCSVSLMLRFGPHAAKACELRQVRKKAAVNSVFRVPWENLIRVGLQKNVSVVVRREVHGPKI